MARLTAFLVWALAAATAVFWGLRVFSQPLAVPAHAQPVAAAGGSPAAVERLFAPEPSAAASAAAPPAASTRFKLLGVMAPREGGRGGVALISVDGQPPRAYRPGAEVGEGYVVQRLGQRSATLGPAGGGGDGGFTLELPPLPQPQTGTLPAADGLATNRPGSTGRPAPANAGGAPQPGVSPQPGEQPAEQPAEEEPSHRRPS
ncbi:hypothetical protein [Caldimonas tepidiphila]|uniref:hypothetical protein n=1 Tax=Caldimonas tepidiphila TaxID=2315841 RepID=UPI00196AEDEF|nr:hypothetical protein [Caldimonas tepidiphila]